MSFFVVIFICVCALLLVLAPLTLSQVRENTKVCSELRTIQSDMSSVLAQLERFRITFEKASDGLVLQNMQGEILWCNPAYCRIHKRKEAEILGRNPLDFALPDHLKPTADELARSPFDIKEGSVQRFLNKRSTGEEFWIELSSSFHNGRDGQSYAIVVCRDVTEAVEQEDKLHAMRDQLEHEATHDALTGIPNRSAFLAFMDQVIADKQADNLGLLHLDLDNFKEINDTHGHSTGDFILQHTAKAIAAAIRKADLVARIGGDEFVVVCPQSADLDFLSGVANRLHDQISQRVEVNGGFIEVEVSIGAAQSHMKKCDPAQLLAQADFALYEAKNAGRNTVTVYDKDLHNRHTLEIRRGRELVDAIDTGEISYVFQPFLNLKTGRIAGFETLARWNHHKEGLLPPSEFLPLVENLGLMGQLDLHSMMAALQKKRQLNDLGYGDIGVTFNASPELLSTTDFISRLTWGIEMAGIRRRDVTIEILENTNFGDKTETSSHAAMIHDLRQAGFNVHLDDFGIGFAGLSHLASLDISGVKIDRSLITNLLTDTISQKVVRKIIELSQDLDLTVIAEGVEDEDTAKMLKQMGCDLIQGYWLARPLPDDDMIEWLARHDDRALSRSA